MNVGVVFGDDVVVRINPTLAAMRAGVKKVTAPPVQANTSICYK